MPAEVSPEVEVIENNEAGYIERLRVKSPYTGFTTYFYVRVLGEAARSFPTEKTARRYLYGRVQNLRARNQATYQ